ncbi:MAG: histidine phosphatase family protein, partial [Actinomycetes bacterium]
MTIDDQTSESRLPRTERPDAPSYLNRHLARRKAQPASPEAEADAALPLYLRQHRGREHRSDPVMYEGNVVGTSRAWAEVTRTKEIIPERRDQLASIDCDIYLVRHGETQGYSSESGLTPLGSWQAHRRGQELARRVTDGMSVEMVCAPTNRARQTGEHLRRGLLDNVGLFGRGKPAISELHDDRNFRNFEV